MATADIIPAAVYRTILFETLKRTYCHKRQYALFLPYASGRGIVSEESVDTISDGICHKI